MDFNETLQKLNEASGVTIVDPACGDWKVFIDGKDSGIVETNYEAAKKHWEKQAREKDYKVKLVPRKSIKEATMTPQDSLALKKKEAAKQALLKANKIKPGDDIALDPTDRTGTKYKIVPANIVNQAKRATVTR
jgi:hypothetical protein